MENQTDNTYRLIGPFREVLTMRELPAKGALKDEQLEIIREGGILIKGELIEEVGPFDELRKKHQIADSAIEQIESDMVAMPGLIDAHTHICFGGSRAMDYAARNAGKSYLEIAREGGGIWSTVRHTRNASKEQLQEVMQWRMDRLLSNGITTVEIKSGYGLSVAHELKMLRAIQAIKSQHAMDVVATCLAAHIVPKDFEEGESAYLEMILNELTPIIQQENLCSRFDIFIEESAFGIPTSTSYLNRLSGLGFQLTVHGDQFTPGGSHVAIECGALSVDHLEASGEKEIAMLAKSNVIPVALPGASIGLGCPFTPARKLLDAGCSLAIASDWNPGSAPQGNLLSQAAILGTFEKLSNAEVLAGITNRAALALGLTDRGSLESQNIADFIGFNTKDHREILYQQGSLSPSLVWKRGRKAVNLYSNSLNKRT